MKQFSYVLAGLLLVPAYFSASRAHGAPHEGAGLESPAPDPKVLQTLTKQERGTKDLKEKQVAERERLRLEMANVPDSPAKRKKLREFEARQERERAAKDTADQQERCTVIGGAQCSQAAK